MEADTYNWNGEKTGTVELPKSVFGVAWNADLAHQVVDILQKNARRPYAHAKGRSEVRGGGKKPWQQKGTGRARHGSIRSPLWKGGGVTHGPTRERIFEKILTKKMRTKAFAMALAKKWADGEILVMDAVAVSEAKPKTAAKALGALSHISGFNRLARKGTKVVVGAENRITARAFRNIPGVRTVEVRNMNILDILGAKYILIGKAAVLNLK